ncbi:ScbA/BarX family gamma-butyrolactone biosynthesis protein [Streptomyces sp. NBC_01275]|uniref:ScbA/BarX family gamma-butyrolactone biosynthesis protein n=1 Tax=Streptomyces sp. NBC_01275 TaxID=2903807 RepID=UPI0022523ED8|nr:ScbA/BarX family gamma-butyrolactone biosynthesis protein [Streptomyces sp. NBC_01275]MCX4761521.1 ScbA/BarX family gamma-butyrolactone biosynthesis protein [Streptomyces sp. NBC_01275]
MSTLSTAVHIVAQEDVHKRDRAEVLLVCWERTGSDTFTVNALWPSQHSFYQTADGLYDPLLFVETVRQNVPLISHIGYDVPIDHHLIWQDFTCEVNPSALQIADAPAVIELRVSCSRVIRRGSRMAALTMDVVALRDGVLLGTARARFTSNPPALYRRLRGSYGDLDRALAAALPPAPPVDAELVARARESDVVLSASDFPHRWLLRSDTAHPILFDHPVDHAPGMLLLEAARQAAQALSSSTGLASVRLDAKFSRYVELDTPCWILAEAELPDLTGRPRAAITALQAGETAFSCSVACQAPALSRVA